MPQRCCPPGMNHTGAVTDIVNSNVQDRIADLLCYIFSLPCFQPYSGRLVLKQAAVVARTPMACAPTRPGSYATTSGRFCRASSISHQAPVSLPPASKAKSHERKYWHPSPVTGAECLIFETPKLGSTLALASSKLGSLGMHEAVLHMVLPNSNAWAGNARGSLSQS